MNVTSRMMAGIGIALALTTAVAAKGPTSRIVISGASLSHPIEITDPATVKPFQVWSGPGVRIKFGGVWYEQTEGFIGDWVSGPVSERPPGLQRYQLSFYVGDKTSRAPSGSPDELAYVVAYEYDPEASQGYVYLPGLGDEWYALNSKTMPRGIEGQWFRANAAWQAVVTSLIARR